VSKAPLLTPSGLDGFILIDKPPSLTSQQVVSRVKRALGVRKAGHAGTLDPMATGLLVVGIGKATRLLGYLSDKDKQYEATIRLGQGTSTDDAEGTPLGEPVDATGISAEMVSSAMTRYVGQIEQVPSSVSAIKVDGRRAYDRVRAGQEVTLAPRPVTVTRFEMRNRVDDPPWADLDVIVDCSSGTYIRALARDLGRDLSVGGHLTALRRTKVGAFLVEDACGLDDVRSDKVLDMGLVAAHVAPRVEVDEAMVREIAVGRSIGVTVPAPLCSVCHGSRLLALYKPDPENPSRAKPVTVFIEPSDLYPIDAQDGGELA